MRDELLQTIIDRKLKPIQKASDGVISAFERDVRTAIEDLTPDGRIKAIRRLCVSYGNLIPKTVISAMRSAGSEYSRIVEYETKLFQELGYLLPPIDLNVYTLPVIEQMKDVELEYIGGQRKLVNTRVKRELIAGAVAGLSASEAIKNIKIELSKLNSNVLHYASTLVRTSAHLIASGVTARIAEAVNVYWFEYAGPRDSIIREFCDFVMRGQFPNGGMNMTRSNIWHISEIRRLDNGQIPGVLLSRGGYNCRHEWQGVSMLKNERLNEKYNLTSE